MWKKLFFGKHLYVSLVAAFICALVVSPAAFAAENDTLNDIELPIENNAARILASWFTPNFPGTLCLRCIKLKTNQQLADFYRSRNFAPYWTEDNGLNRLGGEFLGVLKKIGEHGLYPEDYHYSCIQGLANPPYENAEGEQRLHPRDLAGLDVLLTDAFFTLGKHLSSGKGYGKTYSAFDSFHTDLDLPAILSDLETNRNVAETIRTIAPPHPEYWRLVDAGRRMKKIIEAGGWPAVPKMKQEKLFAGDTSPIIPFVRKRLHASEDLIGDEKSEDENLYDADLEAAVIIFQARHGLPIDGVIGKHTLGELNVSPTKRYQQIMANLEHWRRMPRDFGHRNIRVNIANFTLEGFDNGQKSLEMRVVVGKSSWQTPELSKSVKEVVINPWWHVPQSIIPEIKSTKGYEVREADGRVAISQPPGPRNALGRIKIRFPNRHNVYLHDTPSKYLFARTFRAMSHGCIRMQHPKDAALWLLQDDPEWNMEKVDEKIKRGRTINVEVATPTMVHLVYITAWVGDEGELEFRRDIYNHDVKYLNALTPAALQPVLSAKAEAPQAVQIVCGQVAGSAPVTALRKSR